MCDSNSKNLSSKSDQSAGDGPSSNASSDAKDTTEEPPDADVNTGEQVLNALQRCNSDTSRVLLTDKNLQKAFKKNERHVDVKKIKQGILFKVPCIKLIWANFTTKHQSKDVNVNTSDVTRPWINPFVLKLKG